MGGGSRTLCRRLHQLPLVHQLRSSQPNLSLLQPPLHCSALYGLWLALCRYSPTLHTHAVSSCLLLQGHSLLSSHSATQKHRVNPQGMASIRHGFPFFPQNGNFRRTKQPITDRKDQRIFTLPPSFSMSFTPASSLHGTTLPS